MDLICLDCGIYDETLNNYLIKSAIKELKLKNSGQMYKRIELRIERAEKFLEYLQKQEKEESIELNLPIDEIKYSAKLIKIFEIEKERVLISASRRKNREEKVD